MVYSYGAVEDANTKNGSVFKVNGQKLKPFLELQSPQVEETLLKAPVYQG